MLAAHQVGRFELRDFLGRGAIGDVYLAWDPDSGREVALKVVRANRADPEMLQAEKNGVSLQEQLSRVAPQVATVYEWGQDGDFFWVAMEYVAGTDLSQILSHGSLDQDRAAGIAVQLCEMLEVCHQFSAEVGGRKIYGIVHGDIKPENIRLQDGDRVRVLDFGIAKHLSQTRRFTVNLFGSLPYTPPERLDRGGVDRHSDLWALGVVLYLMVAGYSPFDGGDPEEVEGKIRSGRPPEALPPDISPGLRRIIERSLDYDVARRYATAAEMCVDLAAWIEGKPLPSEQAREEQVRKEMERDPHEDLSATRRTRPPLDDSGSFRSGETRRTGPLPENGLGATRRTVELTELTEPAAAAVPLPAEPPPAPPPAKAQRWPLYFTLALLLGAVGLASQVWVRSEAGAIRHDLATEASPDLDALWARYRRIAPYALLGMGEVRQELKEALVRSADRILATYRGDSPTTTQRGWQKAHDLLKEAVDVDYRDRSARAKMLYAQAHVDRIDSQGMRAKGQRKEAQEKLQDAVDKFEQSAKLVPEWPDPYLGLARVYSYEQPDLPKLEETLSQLQRRNYPWGRREKAMMADAHRLQSQQLLAQAQRARGTDQETELLEVAKDHSSQAIDLYREISPYGDSNANRTAVQIQLAQIESRLEELGFQ
ncbi:MAG: eukaryotic-like serine/threonine-protein kinase [Acidobacteriota bacterium]|jgi:serine/threonine protein kinase|nr:eukaryotic-like serine/threonine-protein kinase [Acidobacteriota bacterium]